MANGRKEPDRAGNAALEDTKDTNFWLVETNHGPHRHGLFSVSVARLTNDEARKLFGKLVLPLKLEERQFDKLTRRLDSDYEGNPEELFTS